MNITDLLTNKKSDSSSSISGVLPGTIVSTMDLMDLGRVQILIPSISMEFVSNWARVSTPMAGNQCGAYFRPEVGDEVLVAFESGDINRPYVIGSLWNGKMSPPVPGYNAYIMEIRSRMEEIPPPPVGLSGATALARDAIEKTAETSADTALRAEEETLAVDEAPSQEADVEGEATAESMEATQEVENVAESTGAIGHVIRMDSREGLAKIEIMDQTGKNMITIDAVTNTIVINALENIELNAPNGAIVMNGANVVINADAEINLNSDVAVNVSSTSVLVDTEEGVNVEAGGEISMSAGGEMALDAGGALNASAGGEAGLSAGGEMSLDAGGALNASAAGEAGISAAGAVSLSAGAELSAEAGAELSISAGAVVNVDAALDVNIAGALINLNL